ncbi:hypothetical protein O9993_18220 [Vibrio lentus]|nr:hypothetical protein [Vibrio lentus]
MKAEDIFAMARLIGTAPERTAALLNAFTTLGHEMCSSIANLQLLLWQHRY